MLAQRLAFAVHICPHINAIRNLLVRQAQLFWVHAGKVAGETCLLGEARQHSDSAARHRGIKEPLHLPGRASFRIEVGISSGIERLGGQFTDPYMIGMPITASRVKRRHYGWLELAD